MDAEVVALSPVQHMTVKRLFLNVLSGDEQFLACNRATLKELGVPERFLIERGWAIRGNKLQFTQTLDKARLHLRELLPAGERAEAATGAPVTHEVVERVAAAIAREEKVRIRPFTFASHVFGAASRRVVVSLRLPLLGGRVWTHDEAGGSGGRTD
jgi:hypothetical protein